MLTKKNKVMLSVGFYLVIAVILIFTLLPIAWMVLTSFKTKVDIYSSIPKLFFKPSLKGWEHVLFTMPTLRFILNGLIVAGFNTAICLIVGTLAAFSLSRFKMKGKENIAFFLLTFRMFPPIAAAVPLFVIFKTFKLIDTQLSLIFAYILFNLPFTVWLMREFISSIPVSLEEAAMVDGLTRMQAFRKVELPLLKSSLAAVGIFCFIFAWNEFIFALLFTQSMAKTMPVQISQFITWKEVTWENASAAGTIFVLPVLVLVFFIQKYLVIGLSLGTVKG